MNKLAEVLHAMCLKFYERFDKRAHVQVWMKTAIPEFGLELVSYVCVLI